MHLRHIAASYKPPVTEKVSSWASTSVCIDKLAFGIEDLPCWSLTSEFRIIFTPKYSWYDTECYMRQSFPTIEPIAPGAWHGYTVTIAHSGHIWVCASAVTGLGTLFPRCWGSHHHLWKPWQCRALLSPAKPAYCLCALPPTTAEANLALNADGGRWELTFHTRGF